MPSCGQCRHWGTKCGVQTCLQAKHPHTSKQTNKQINRCACVRVLACASWTSHKPQATASKPVSSASSRSLHQFLSPDSYLDFPQLDRDLGHITQINLFLPELLLVVCCSCITAIESTTGHHVTLRTRAQIFSIHVNTWADQAGYL